MGIKLRSPTYQHFSDLQKKNDLDLLFFRDGSSCGRERVLDDVHLSARGAATADEAETTTPGKRDENGREALQDERQAHQKRERHREWWLHSPSGGEESP